MDEEVLEEGEGNRRMFWNVRRGKANWIDHVSDKGL